METNRASGLSLIELTIVVTVIAIIASLAIPNLLGARVTANESTAIGNLRTIANAQAQFQGRTVADFDGDGRGEFGYLVEMAGGIPVRAPTGKTPESMNLPVLPAGFRLAVSGVVQRGGYLYRMYLPNAAGIGIEEAPEGGAQSSNLPAAHQAEMAWCCYAWPLELGITGDRSFMISHNGQILQALNATNYSGRASGPTADAAFVSPSTTGSIIGVLAVNTTGADGNRWVIVQ